MMKAFITILISFLASLIFAQKTTHLGIEGSITNDSYDLVEYGNQLKNIPLLGARIGVTVKQEINQHLSGEIGFTFKRYKEGYGFNHISGGTTMSAFGAYCFPLRLYSHINLHKNKLFVSPVVGLVYCYSPYADSYASGEGRFSSGSDSVTIYTYTQYGPNKSFALLQTGISLDIKFNKGGILSFFSSYCTGFTQIYKSNITYKINDKPFVNGHGISKGSFWDVIGISYRFQISKFWQKK